MHYPERSKNQCFCPLIPALDSTCRISLKWLSCSTCKCIEAYCFGYNNKIFKCQYKFLFQISRRKNPNNNTKIAQSFCSKKRCIFMFESSDDVCSGTISNESSKSKGN